MQTPDGFRSLAASVLAARTPSAAEPGLEVVEEMLASPVLRQAQDDKVQAQDDKVQAQDDKVQAQDDKVQAQHDGVNDELFGDDEIELARDVRLFHARVIEAVEAAVEMLVNDIAADVLGRELELAPADIERIVDRALRRFAEEEPLRVRVHADDAARLNCGVPVVADARLRPGDAVIDLRGGSVDASLGVRLAALVRAALA